MSSNENSPYLNFEDGAIRQGDILLGVSFKYVSQKQTGDAELRLGFPFPYAVILSQACDLEQHYQNLAANITVNTEGNDDKILDTVLVCPAFASEQLLTGTHLLPERKMFDFDGPKGQEKALEKLKKNDTYNRYHYLESMPDIFPELIIDFKKFHTVPIDILEEYYKSNYRASLGVLFRERLSQRFSNYLSRIGLPGGVRNQ